MFRKVKLKEQKLDEFADLAKKFLEENDIKVCEISLNDLHNFFSYDKTKENWLSRSIREGLQKRKIWLKKVSNSTAILVSQNKINFGDYNKKQL